MTEDRTIIAVLAAAVAAVVALLCYGAHLYNSRYEYVRAACHSKGLALEQEFEQRGRYGETTYHCVDSYGRLYAVPEGTSP